MSDPIVTDRRSFMRQALTTLAIGAGLAMVPSVARSGGQAEGSQGTARGQSVRSQVTCCPYDCNPGHSCNPGKIRYLCQGTCPTYCTCHSNVGCYTIPC
jgi:hypothetical protein